MLKSSLCDYSDAYILVSETITIAPQAENNTNNVNIEILFKNIAPFTDSISEINNTQINNAKDIDVVMPMYNLMEYSYSYSKTSGSFGNTVKIIQQIMVALLLIFVLLITVLRLNLNRK